MLYLPSLLLPSSLCFLFKSIDCVPLRIYRSAVQPLRVCSLSHSVTIIRCHSRYSVAYRFQRRNLIHCNFSSRYLVAYRFQRQFFHCSLAADTFQINKPRVPLINNNVSITFNFPARRSQTHVNNNVFACVF